MAQVEQDYAEGQVKLQGRVHQLETLRAGLLRELVALKHEVYLRTAPH